MPSGTINALNSATFPALTPGSYVSAQPTRQGLLTLTIEVGAGLTGTLTVYTSLGGVVDRAIATASVTNVNTGATGAITSAGTYTVTVPNGTAYLICTAYSSGSCIVTLNLG